MLTLSLIGWLIYIVAAIMLAWKWFWDSDSGFLGFFAIEFPPLGIGVVIVVLLIPLMIGASLYYDIYGRFALNMGAFVITGIVALGLACTAGIVALFQRRRDDFGAIPSTGDSLDDQKRTLVSASLFLVQFVGLIASILGIISFYRDIG